MNSEAARPSLAPVNHRRADRVFLSTLIALGSIYLLLIVALLVADGSFVRVADLRAALESKEIQYAIRLSLLSCTLSSVMALWVAVPLAYLLARFDFRGKRVVDAIVDIPVVLPPLVLGLSLLILFQTALGDAVESILPVTFRVPAVVLAQFTVATAFAVRTLRVSFEQIDPRTEQVAWTLGCSRAAAFFRVVLPQARHGLVAAVTLAWARAFGEFGPILVFAGATRMRTEVLSTTVFLELSLGKIESAVSVSMLMIAFAMVVLVLARVLGLRKAGR